jgi:FAD/FMN-containing dehydrogenase
VTKPACSRSVTDGRPSAGDGRTSLPFRVRDDQRPVAVVFPEAAEDIAAVVEVAGARGLRVAPQGTGHGAGPMGPLEGTILIKTLRMRGVEIDARAKRARVQAGALWGEVVPAAAEHGLAALAGSAKDVGVVGYTLGGGIGWLARRRGLACSSVLAVD